MRIMLPDERRERFRTLAAEQGASHASLSRLLGRGEGYIARYLSDSVPYDLAPADTALLADFLGVDAVSLKASPRARRRA